MTQNMATKAKKPICIVPRPDWYSFAVSSPVRHHIAFLRQRLARFKWKHDLWTDARVLKISITAWRIQWKAAVAPEIALVYAFRKESGIQ